MKKIRIILATHNGEKYLEKQLKSIRDQSYKNFELVVCDDSSTDQTKDILGKFKDSGLIREIYTVNFGNPTLVFAKLLELSPENLCVAFCDQDDIWLESKLEKLIQYANSDFPLLITSPRIYINENDTIVGKSHRVKRTSSWKNAVIQNIAPGNCTLINPTASQVLKRVGFPAKAHYDAWMYLVVSLVGNVKFVEDPLVFYRLHDGNHVGINRRWAPVKFLRNLVKFRDMCIELNGRLHLLPQTQEILEFKVFSDAISHKNFLRRFTSCFKSGLYRQNLLESIAAVLLFAIVCSMKPASSLKHE